MPLTYQRYLQLDPLLSLQRPLSDGPEHDETLFIIIHQVYELWFKQILHELDHLCHLFTIHTPRTDTTPRILHTLKRTLTILKTMVAQVDILETMTPMSFNSFRARLDTASGFESAQFREVEFLLGHRNSRMLSHHKAHAAAHERLTRRMAEPSVYQRFLGYLLSLGYPIPEELLAPAGEAPPPESEAVRTVLIRIYREDDRTVQVCERLVDLDEGLQEWRYRHVKMVERTIGTKSGTGGSSGAAYLKGTLSQPVFPDLWAIRTAL